MILRVKAKEQPMNSLGEDSEFLMIQL